jgi:excisionase family DNA binding protein
MNKAYLTVQELAKKCGVHPETVRIWIRTGKVDGEIVNKQWRIYEDAVRKIIDAREDSK